MQEGENHIVQEDQEPQYHQQQLGVLSKTLSSRAVVQILDFFFDHKEFDYSPAEIAEKTGLSFKTIFRELPTLEKYKLVCISRKIGKTNMYRLNTELSAVAHLERFSLEMSQIVTTADDYSPVHSQLEEKMMSSVKK
jgi:DNA-binding transcriptional ArsR family regulator